MRADNREKVRGPEDKRAFRLKKREGERNGRGQ